MDLDKEKFPAQWLHDVLEPNEIDETPSILKNYAMFPGFCMGYYAMKIRNKYLGRPTRWNLPIMLASSAFCGFFAYVSHEIVHIQKARRDAVTREYIMLHPERFPDPYPKSYAEIFRDWIPAR
ncbi:unnamed protein product [Xylocopa violacea]|uniref:NADH dehydrogenase [ubiquinone] 1 subunit C2 n=1 Tax=Xylocopa violacea TaxID=135666 RepID=A0ABP1NWJ4_XYLVO